MRSGRYRDLRRAAGGAEAPPAHASASLPVGHQGCAIQSASMARIVAASATEMAACLPVVCAVSSLSKVDMADVKPRRSWPLAASCALARWLQSDTAAPFLVAKRLITLHMPSALAFSVPTVGL